MSQAVIIFTMPTMVKIKLCLWRPLEAQFDSLIWLHYLLLADGNRSFLSLWLLKLAFSK
jgi:hypothetical protein